MRGDAPNMPFKFIMQTATTLVGVDYCHIYCQNTNGVADAQVKCAQFFGIHHANLSSDVFREASGEIFLILFI